MSEGGLTLKKVIPIIVATWILSLVTTLAVVYVSPSIFPSIFPIGIGEGTIPTEKIADSAIITTKLADETVTSAKILDGTLTAVDIADGSIITVNVADGAITTEKIADGTVTSNKLTPYTIPFASTQTQAIEPVDSTANWVDIPSTSVTVTLERTSHLLIMFSAMAYSDNPAEQILIRVKVDEEIVLPEQIRLTPIMHEAGSHTHSMSQELGWPSTHDHTIYSSGSHAHVINYMAYSYNFVQPTIGAGTHTIQMQWKVTGGLGYVAERTLAVIALPA